MQGTSADQDTRFSNKQAKLMKSQKFAPELDHLVRFFNLSLYIYMCVCVLVWVSDDGYESGFFVLFFVLCFLLKVWRIRRQCNF